MRQRRRTWQTLLATTASLTVVALTGCGGTGTEAKSTPKASAASFEGKGTINYVSNRDASGAANKTIEESGTPRTRRRRSRSSNCRTPRTSSASSSSRTRRSSRTPTAC